MSEPGETIDQDAVASLDPDEVAYDQDLALGEDGEEDVARRSYVPNDRPLAVGQHGSTAGEQLEGSSLEERVNAERPDVAGERPGDEVLPTEQPLTDALGEDVAAEDLVVADEEDSEVGDLRAGRLVDPDEGVREDREKDLVAQDVGIDGGAAGAEKAAMHVVADPRS